MTIEGNKPVNHQNSIPVSSLPSPPQNKIDRVSQPILKKTAPIHFSPFKFVAKVIRSGYLLIDRLVVLWQSLFASETQKKANQLGVGYYRGEQLENAKRIEMETVETSGLIKKVDHLKNASQIKTNALNTIREFLKGDEQAFKTIIDPFDSQNSLQVLDIFNHDFPRSQFWWNGEQRYNNRDYTLSKGEKQTSEETMRMEQASFNMYQELSEHFNQNEFRNIASLMNQQPVIQDVLGHVIHRTGYKGTDLPVKSPTGLKMSLNEQDDSVYIILQSTMTILNPQDMEETLGYVATERKIILSREDLGTDWSQTELEKIAPSARVIDTYSRFAITQKEAENHLNLIKED